MFTHFQKLMDKASQLQNVNLLFFYAVDSHSFRQEKCIHMFVPLSCDTSHEFPPFRLEENGSRVWLKFLHSVSL